MLNARVGARHRVVLDEPPDGPQDQDTQEHVQANLKIKHRASLEGGPPGYVPPGASPATIARRSPDTQDAQPVAPADVPPLQVLHAAIHVPGPADLGLRATRPAIAHLRPLTLMHQRRPPP